MREYRMLFERVKAGESAIGDEIGLRSKLGGSPNWEQDAETPICPHCSKEMTFVAQIDSIEHQGGNNPHGLNWVTDHQDYMFGDAGMIYLFICHDCSEPKAVMQYG